MLNAAEAALMEGAEDDSARQRIRAKLYAPPPGSRARRPRPPAMVTDRRQAQALAAQLAAEDARLMGGDSS